MMRICGASAFAATAIPAINPPAADRHDQRIELRIRRQHFQRDGSLSRHDQRIIERVDQRRALTRDEGARMGLGFGERFAVQHHARPMRARVLHLHQRRRLRHDDGRGNVHPPRVIGHSLGMITRRHGHDAARALCLVERCEPVHRPRVP